MFSWRRKWGYCVIPLIGKSYHNATTATESERNLIMRLAEYSVTWASHLNWANDAAFVIIRILLSLLCEECHINIVQCFIKNFRECHVTLRWKSANWHVVFIVKRLALQLLVLINQVNCLALPCGIIKCKIPIKSLSDKTLSNPTSSSLLSPPYSRLV